MEKGGRGREEKGGGGGRGREEKRGGGGRGREEKAATLVCTLYYGLLLLIVAEISEVQQDLVIVSYPQSQGTDKNL